MKERKSRAQNNSISFNKTNPLNTNSEAFDSVKDEEDKGSEIKNTETTDITNNEETTD